jgi:hypothetical protein
MDTYKIAFASDRGSNILKALKGDFLKYFHYAILKFVLFRIPAHLLFCSQAEQYLEIGFLPNSTKERKENH